MTTNTPISDLQVCDDSENVALICSGRMEPNHCLWVGLLILALDRLFCSTAFGSQHPAGLTVSVVDLQTAAHGNLVR